MSLTNPDRLFPVEPRIRDMARAFYDSVRDLPIISPHGHCEPRWFAENKRFPNPAELLVVPDHYLFRMLASQGVALVDLGIPRADDGDTEQDDALYDEAVQFVLESRRASISSTTTGSRLASHLVSSAHS